MTRPTKATKADQLVSEVLTLLERGERSKAVSALVDAIEDTAVDDHGAAAMLGVSRRTLQDYRQKGEGPPYFKWGGAVRYLRRDVRAFREECRKTCTVDVPQGGEVR